MSGTYPVPAPNLEVFANCASCVATSTYGTTSPSALTNETWTMGTGYTSFPTAQQTTYPYNYFYIRDPADTANEICMVILGGGGTSTWSVIRGACGTTPVAHSSGATWVQVISPGTMQNLQRSSDIRPVDVGVIAWTANPSTYIGTSSAYATSAAGSLFLFAFKNDMALSANHISYGVYPGGSGLSNCYLGLYDWAGNLIGQCTADQSTNMASTGLYTVNLSSAVALSANSMYRVGMVIGAASSMPSFMVISATLSYAFTNLGLSHANYISATIGSGYTALPSTYTPGSLSAQTGPVVFVIS